MKSTIDAVKFSNTIHAVISILMYIVIMCIDGYSGADPGFQGRGGGALKKIVPSGGRREHFWGISCEKSRFYVKKYYFFKF